MTRRLLLLAVLLLVLSARAASALDYSGLRLLSHAWPDVPAAKVSEIGRGIGVVFSPDLSVEGNCRFYQALASHAFRRRIGGGSSIRFTATTCSIRRAGSRRSCSRRTGPTGTG